MDSEMNARERLHLHALCCRVWGDEETPHLRTDGCDAEQCGQAAWKHYKTAALHCVYVGVRLVQALCPKVAVRATGTAPLTFDASYEAHSKAVEPQKHLL
ncbi:hypothetical protein PsorP6_009699 [Peronosclerospora sorghi]|uniref:Uncharacterized protein n=1 Tax=Peronosclerospora sorghi TaxID=230839 RepID=A0ACC0VZ26_9STRA|nr:hypothetical protein PsorP6_009699 [Peronosclerospora sorghi]